MVDRNERLLGTGEREVRIGGIVEALTAIELQQADPEYWWSFNFLKERRVYRRRN